MDELFREKIVNDIYNNPQVVGGYRGNIGLWRAEEILIQRFFPKKGCILDIGCGAGRTSIPLAQMGFKVVGIDLSPTMVNAARLEASRLDINIDFLVMNATALEFDDQSFDGALFSFNGIDYVPGYIKKRKVLSEVFRILTPGAHLIFSVHRIWCPYFFWKIILGGIRLNLGSIIGYRTSEKEWGEIYNLDDERLEDHYLHFLSLRRWKRALHDTGFDLVFNKSVVLLEYPGFREYIRKSLGSENYMYFVAQKPNT